MKKYSILLHFCFIVCSVSAQQMMVSNGFYDNIMLENPAGAGMYPDSANHIQLYYKKQYLSLPDAPTHLTATFDKVLPSKKVGIGIKMMSDKFSYLLQQGLEGSFAYYVLQDVGRDSDLRYRKYVNTLSIGLSAGYLNRRLDLSNLSARDKDDMALFGQNPVNQHQMSLSVGAHGKWGAKSFLVQSGAAWNYLSPNFARRDTTATFLRNDGYLIGYLRFEFAVRSPVTFEPMAIVRYNTGKLAWQQEYSLTINLKPYGNRYSEYVPRLFVRGGVKTTTASGSNILIATGIQITKVVQMMYCWENASIGLGSTNEFGMNFAF
jgi:type IX secretion system PorP/SprF family membrane protein